MPSPSRGPFPAPHRLSKHPRRSPVLCAAPRAKPHRLSSPGAANSGQIRRDLAAPSRLHRRAPRSSHPRAQMLPPVAYPCRGHAPRPIPGSNRPPECRIWQTPVSSLARHCAPCVPPPPARPKPQGRSICFGRTRLDLTPNESEPFDQDPTAQNPRYRFRLVFLLKSPTVS